MIFEPVFTCYGKAGPFKTLGDCHAMALINLTGTGSAFNCESSTGTKKCDRPGFDWQCVLLVF